MASCDRRLSSATHALARRALAGEFGRSLVDLPLSLDKETDLADAAEETRYGRAVMRIAQECPIRIEPTELIVGSATLAAAPKHRVPAYWHGEPIFPSISHVTPGFDFALELGYAGLRDEINLRLGRGDLDESGTTLLEAMLVCLDAAQVWHRRHLDELDKRIAASQGLQRAHYRAVRQNLQNVPEHPPRTFREAVQALWFLFAFQRLCGNWPGIGRFDAMLGPYLDRDLGEGRLTLDEARELVAHFWIKGAEWCGASTSLGGSGDAQHYENVVLGGVDSGGRDIANPVTHLVLDVVEELRISDLPIAVRVGIRTPRRILERIAQVQRLGGGIVAIYNEEQVLASLERFGYPLEVARRYANDGCWELQIPGETAFSYYPIDLLGILQRTLGVVDEGEPPSCATFEALYAAFRAHLFAAMDDFSRVADGFMRGGGPSALLSLLTRDCVAKARGYLDRGARYTVLSPHAGGIPDAADSLVAIKRLVYDDRRLTLNELVNVLRDDWAGREALRREVTGRFPAYGNDEPDADAMARRVLGDFLEAAERVPERNGVLRPPGVSTFGRTLAWREARGATAAGRHAGEIMSNNFSPAPGADRRGPTAVIESHTSMDLVRLPNGTALELKIHPSAVRGEEGLASLVDLMRTFLRLGGLFLQIDVVDNATLREAQAHPERYPHLAVRVSGWSARFVTLDSEWQDLIIERTQQT
jgi:pyruvate-formate lyase